MTLSYNPTVANDGLVLYMDFVNPNTYSGTGNTAFDLISGKSYALVSSPTFDSTGPKCFNLNGSTHYLSGNVNQLNFGTGDFTIQTNFKLNGLSNGFTGAYNAAFVCAAAGSTGSCLIQVGGGSTSYTNIGIYHETTGILSSINYNFSTNVIYNLALARSSGVLTAYVNGTAIGSTTTTNLYDFNKGGNFIGRHYFGGYEQYFKGNVYSLQAYSRGLSSTEILQNYNATKKRFLPEENIVGNGLVLNLDPAKSNSYSGIGNTIFDLSGMGNTGALINGPTFSPFNSGSIVFDGTNDFIISSANVGIVGNSPRTICVWIYVPFSQSKNVCGYGVGSPGQMFDLLVWDTGGYNRVIGHYYSGGYDTIGTLPSRNTINVPGWNFITHTYYGTTVSLFCNAVFSNSVNLGVPLNTENSSLVIGKGIYAGYDYFSGSVGALQIYNRALTQQEILQNYNATKSRFGLS
jgi:hypothetical protein